jgi:hypothetical protein
MVGPQGPGESPIKPDYQIIDKDTEWSYRSGFNRGIDARFTTIEQRIQGIETQLMGLMEGMLDLLRSRAYLQLQQDQGPAPKPVEPSTLRGDSGPQAMVVRFPSPWDHIQIVVGIDPAQEPLGMWMRAEVALVGGERTRYHVVFMDDEEKDEYDELLNMIDREAGN